MVMKVLEQLRRLFGRNYKSDTFAQVGWDLKGQTYAIMGGEKIKVRGWVVRNKDGKLIDQDGWPAK